MKGIIIPYYENLISIPDADLDRIVYCIQSYPQVPIVVAFWSGDYNYVWRQYSQWAYDAIKNAGGKAICYFSTTGPYISPTPIDWAKSKIDTLYSLYPNIDGIFLDEYANAGPGAYKPVSWYTELCQYIRTKATSTFIVGNQGGPSLGSEWYTQYPNAPDVVLIYENSGVLPSTSTLQSNYGSPSRNGIIPYNITSASVSDSTYNSLANAVDWVYLNDEPNKSGLVSAWGGCSSWLERQCQLLSPFNSSPSSSPSSSISPSSSVSSSPSSSGSPSPSASTSTVYNPALKIKTSTSTITIETTEKTEHTPIRIGNAGIELTDSSPIRIKTSQGIKSITTN